MKGRNRRLLLAGVALLTAGPAALALRPGRMQDAAPVELEAVLPLHFAGWSADVPRFRTEVPGLATGYAGTHSISRIYTNAQGDSLALQVSYGGPGNDAMKGRRPEESLAVQGIQVGEVRRDRLRLANGSVPITRLTSVRDAHTEPMTYWITVGNRTVRSRGEWLAAQLWQGLAGHAVEGLQVSVSSRSEEVPQAFAEHDRFLSTLLAEIPPAGLARLVGWRPS